MYENLYEAVPYLKGHKFSDVTIENQFRCNEALFVEFLEMLNNSLTARTNLESVETANAFAKLEPDFKKRYETEVLSELFYAAKIGMMSPHVPSKLLFLCKKCLSEYKTLSILPVVISSTLATEIFAKGYLDGKLTVGDVMEEMYPGYEVTSLRGSRTVFENYVEIFTWDNNIVMLPRELGEMLTQTDIDGIYLDKKDEVFKILGGKQLRFISPKYVGVTSNVYDLRTLY